MMAATTGTLSHTSNVCQIGATRLFREVGVQINGEASEIQRLPQTNIEPATGGSAERLPLSFEMLTLSALQRRPLPLACAS